MDRIIKSITALGVPALILLLASSINGLAGAAAITSALRMLGGSFGMVGGLAISGIIAMVSKIGTDYSFDAIAIKVLKKLYSKGETKKDILDKINSYPISGDLKIKLKEKLNEISAKSKK